MATEFKGCGGQSKRAAALRVPMPSSLRIEFFMQKFADSPDRLPPLRQRARSELPDMRHARPDLDHRVNARLAHPLAPVHRVVVQDLVAADLDQRGRQAGRI